MGEFYKKHMFFCCNQKSESKKCCAIGDAELMFSYARQRLKKLDQFGAGKVRVSKSGCLGRCDLGPCLLIYPQGDWYTYKDCEDIDRIIKHAVLADEALEELLLPQNS